MSERFREHGSETVAPTQVDESLKDTTVMHADDVYDPSEHPSWPHDVNPASGEEMRAFVVDSLDMSLLIDGTNNDDAYRAVRALSDGQLRKLICTICNIPQPENNRAFVIEKSRAFRHDPESFANGFGAQRELNKQEELRSPLGVPTEIKSLAEETAEELELMLKEDREEYRDGHDKEIVEAILEEVMK